MNFKQAAMPFLAAIAIAVAIWATIGSPRTEQLSVLGDKRRLAGPP